VADKSSKTGEELKKMAEEIREHVRREVKDALKSEDAGDPYTIKAAVSLDLDVNFGHEHTVSEKIPSEVRSGDDFWDLGKPKERVYAPPKFSGKSLSVTEVTDGRDRDGAAVVGEAEKTDRSTVQAEKILPREAYQFRDSAGSPSTQSASARVRNTVDGPRAFPAGQGSRVVTSSYRRKSSALNTRQDYLGNARKPAETVKTYRPDGILIREVSVKTWESDTEFYGRFASDAVRSHSSPPEIPWNHPMENVPYFSYVPQYAHMNLSQMNFYRHLRENIRHGNYPDCDLAYIQLYIFEIINLPDVIPPEEGAEILAGIWMNYRRRHPRLDSFLCEWLADYCLIGGCPLPKSVDPILHEIVPKAQFKEFYLNTLGSDSPDDLGRTVLEVSSDYDYRSGRYYRDHEDAYNELIPRAVGLVMRKAKEEGRGIFAMDRVYKMTRDSYSGAIVSSGIKRRIDIEFLSFTRRADTRQTVTAIAKYAENRLRAVLGIKAKLGVDKISPEDTAVIDGFFEPMLPKTAKKSSEDRYMPDDYMKNYESEDSGFDFAAAQAIEAQSWINTSRLTGDDSYSEDLPTMPEYEADVPVTLSGELSTDHAEDVVTDEMNTADVMLENGQDDEIIPFDDTAESAAEGDEPAADEAADELRDALRAALMGEFRLYCRRNNLYEGEVADRVNNIFLDEIGDVVLENSGGGFELIEDYREDVENWLR